MIAELNAALTSLKAAGEIATALWSLRDDALLKEQAADLVAKIVAAQRSTLAALEEQAALMQRNDALEKELAELKAWNAEKERYELREITPGFLAYALKKNAEGTEPEHQLCPTCYQGGRKAILQFQRPPMEYPLFRCFACDLEFRVFA